jgi:hypothetical protein
VKCPRCGGLIIDDQWNPGKKKCVNCGRNPESIGGRCISKEATMTNEGTGEVKETVMESKKKCSKCQKSFPATSEYFSKNKATTDGFEH